MTLRNWLRQGVGEVQKFLHEIDEMLESSIEEDERRDSGRKAIEYPDTRDLPGAPSQPQRDSTESGQSERVYTEENRVTQQETTEEALKEMAEANGMTVEELQQFLIDIETSEPDIETQSMKRRRIQDSYEDEFEQMLWSSVVFPEKITTTYENIHMPRETILALQSATTNFLIDRTQFTEGLLAENCGHSVILHGPPGTGKTQLVKAVAKECNVTVLNVSAADFMQKWVGESEKVVRTVFRLAGKLSPCMIFIDEADAICRTRGSLDKSWERTFFSQLIQEWDGFATDSSKQIMVIMATNRLWDLDSAAIRRASTRILVDMPSLQDRECILKIHLAKENLGDDVDLKMIAERTSRFTGSDLKGLCVHAAQTALWQSRQEEENVHAKPSEQISDTVPRNTPSGASGKTLTLRMEHFEKALATIKPSVDPNSLARIYGYVESQGEIIANPSTDEEDDECIVEESQISRSRKFKSRLPHGK